MTIVKKEPGRPKGVNFPVNKLIRISQKQNENWRNNPNTPNLIKDLLDGKLGLDTEILKKMIPEFIKQGIELDLDEKEIERVKELYDKI